MLFLREKTGKQKAKDLLLTGRRITSQEANRVIGWKFASRIGEAIKDLEAAGIKVIKHVYRKRYRTYEIEEEK